jgi:hypothetical protein
MHTPPYSSSEPSPEPEPVWSQFGLRLKIGRVEAFAGLTEKCTTNNKVVENNVKDASNTYHALDQRGVTDATGAEGGLVRLGVGAADGSYCHSYTGISGVCRSSSSSGATAVSSLHLLVNQRKPFSDTGGRINYRAVRVLAHEMGHFFGM